MTSNSMTYKWRPDARFPVGAQIAAQRLNEIKLRRGDITPQHVVEDARDPASPLHRCFEWTDEKAADAYRLQQARQMIGALIVVKVADAPVKRETRAFVHITMDRPRYEPVEYALSRPDMRAEVLARAKGEIAAWRSRYAAYEEFGEVHAQIDLLLAAAERAAA